MKIVQSKALRLAKDLTQADVAEHLGLTDKSTVSKWETGESYPRTELLIKLAELYNCTTDRLLGINEAPEP